MTVSYTHLDVYKRQALDSEQARETMIRNQHKWIPEDAAGAICRFVEAKTGKKL